MNAAAVMTSFNPCQGLYTQQHKMGVGMHSHMLQMLQLHSDIHHYTVKMVFIDKYVHMTPITEAGHQFLFSLEPCLQICNYELTHPSVKEKYSPLKHQETCLYESQEI
jgi:hypothetical protein